jgi:hypothetical protein
MTKGFGGFVEKNKINADGKAKIIIDDEEYKNLMRDYKKIKKYMKSPLFQVKTMDGTETYVSKLIEESKDLNM